MFSHLYIELKCVYNEQHVLLFMKKKCSISSLGVQVCHIQGSLHLWENDNKYIVFINLFLKYGI
jgi:hypothetical protein